MGQTTGLEPASTGTTNRSLNHLATPAISSLENISRPAPFASTSKGRFRRTLRLPPEKSNRRPSSLLFKILQKLIQVICL